MEFRLPPGKPRRTDKRQQNVPRELRRPARLLPECVNCGNPLAGPDAVARGPDTAWHLQCWECYEFSASQLELTADQPEGAPIRIYRCRRCGTTRSCRPGWNTRCHVCLDERSVGPVVTDAGYVLLNGRGGDPELRRPALTPPTGEQIRRAVEASSLRVLADVLRAAQRPAWEILAADVHGLPWTGTRTSAVSHGTWGRHKTCGTIARLDSGPIGCPACEPEPGPESTVSCTGRDAGRRHAGRDGWRGRDWWHPGRCRPGVCPAF